MRTHIVLPDDIVKGVDELVGKRKRSQFIAEATRERLRREQLLKVLKETAGTLDISRHPEWETPEKVVEWVRALRRTPSIREQATGEVLARRKRGGRLAKGQAKRSPAVR